MLAALTLPLLAPLLALSTVLDEQPAPEDVKAGWTAFALFGLGLLTVALLGLSLNRHLKRAAQSESDGRFDPTDRAPRTEPRVEPRVEQGDGGRSAS